MLTKEPFMPPMDIEVARYHLRDGRHVAMCFVDAEDSFVETVSLGVWRAGVGSLTPRNELFILAVADMALARELVATAISTAPHAAYDDEGVATLARYEDLTVRAIRSPDGTTWFTLGWVDGWGVIAVPMSEAGALGQVLAAAEEKLHRLGLIEGGPSSAIH